MSNFYLNGNAQMHGTRWIADGTTGVPVPMERVLAMCDSHAALLAALRTIAGFSGGMSDERRAEHMREIARVAIANATKE
jgi:hypothetical protein